MKVLHTITWILIVVGALNWGLVGTFHFNLVMKIFGSMPMIENIIYILVGLSGLFEIFNHKNSCKMCNPSGMMSKPSM